MVVLILTRLNSDETNLEALNIIYSRGENKPTSLSDLDMINQSTSTCKFYVKFKDKIILKTVKLCLALDASVSNKYIGLYN